MQRTCVKMAIGFWRWSPVSNSSTVSSHSYCTFCIRLHCIYCFYFEIIPKPTKTCLSLLQLIFLASDPDPDAKEMFTMACSSIGPPADYTWDESFHLCVLASFTQLIHLCRSHTGEYQDLFDSRITNVLTYYSPCSCGDILNSLWVCRGLVVNRFKVSELRVGQDTFSEGAVVGPTDKMWCLGLKWRSERILALQYVGLTGVGAEDVQCNDEFNSLPEPGVKQSIDHRIQTGVEI